MRLMFFYNVGKDVGSAQTIHNYSRVSHTLGHEVVVYGRQRSGSKLNYSMDVESADLIVFVLESWLEPHYPGFLNLVRLIGKTSRKRRVVIDNDGLYNNLIRVDGDFSHPSEDECRARNEFYESISDVILQPSLHPTHPNVRTFIFHGYDPRIEAPLDFSEKEFGMFYVGNNWFRWKAMRRVLQAIEPIRNRLGRIGLAGWSWAEMPYWVPSPLREQACYTDPEYLKKLGVEIMPAIPVDQVIATMSKGIFSPVLVRPLFNHLRMVNPRMFETPAANTIPLFDLDPEYVREILGEEALELVLPSKDPEGKILDMLSRPEHYFPILRCVRRHLSEKHSYEVRFRELIEVVRKKGGRGGGSQAL